MSFSNDATQPDWSENSARAHAFRDLVLALGPADTYTSAVEAAARPIALGIGAAVMIGLYDSARDAVHALGVYDPLPHRGGVLDELFDAPFERRGLVGQALEKEQPQVAEVDDEYIQDTWPNYVSIAEDFRLRYIAVAPFKTLGEISGVVWAGRTEDEPPFGDTDAAFLGDCGAAIAVAVEAGFLREALQRAAGRRAAVLDPGPPASGERRRETLLSERERDVLRLLAAGKTNREVADELHLSVRTVEWHRARIQWKLGVSGRADLTRAAREQGV